MSQATISPNAARLKKASEGVRRLADAIPLGGGSFDDSVTKDNRNHAVYDGKSPPNTRRSAAPKGVLVKLEGVCAGLPRPTIVAEKEEKKLYQDLPKKVWDKASSAWVDASADAVAIAESDKAQESTTAPAHWDKATNKWSNTPQAEKSGEYMSLPMASDAPQSPARSDQTYWDRKESCWKSNAPSIENPKTSEAMPPPADDAKIPDPKLTAKSRLTITVNESDDTVGKILSPDNLGRFERKPATRRISAPNPYNAKVMYVTDSRGKASVADSLPLDDAITIKSKQRLRANIQACWAAIVHSESSGDRKWQQRAHEAPLSWI